MSITREGTMTLTREGETVLETPLQFTYLQPGEVPATDLYPDSISLCRRDGTPIGEIGEMRHESGDGSGTICVKLTLRDGTSQTIQFYKTENTT